MTLEKITLSHASVSNIRFYVWVATDMYICRSHIHRYVGYFIVRLVSTIPGKKKVEKDAVLSFLRSDVSQTQN